jgi:SAM-dependent methyltransferase
MSDREADRSIWNSIFREVPDEWFSAPPSEAMELCLRFFRQHPPRRLLDAGAGIGRWAVYLRRGGIGSVVAVDYAHAGCRHASAWSAREGLSVSAVVADVVALPFGRAVFDGLLAALVVENLDDHDQRLAFEEFRSVTTAGACGFFLFNPVLTDAELASLSASDNPTRHCHGSHCSDEEIQARLEGWLVLHTGTTRERLRFVQARRI